MDARGLYTEPNLLSKVPEGALVEADNVIIDRDGVLQSRRGMTQYGNSFGIGSDRSKQLLVYKNRILVHYQDTLLFNANSHTNANNGSFQPFSGSYTETELGLRIKGTESNRNFYFTTNDGIKKISAKTAADFTTATDFITDAGGVKALDVTGQLNVTSGGFLPPNSKVAYRVVWGITDRNDNLILGTPSSRLVISNFSDVSANVDLEFVIPQEITSSYFYQIYRTAVFTASGSLNLDDIDPGDDMQLVIEDFPTNAQLTADLVTLTDITPEDFRQGGTYLYTNPNSGEGINQSNEPPPLAKDLTLYQSTMFYANTTTRARKTISLLGLSGMISGTSSITISDGVNTPQTYTFVGEKEISNIDFTSYIGTIPADANGKYWLLNSSSNKRRYYIWYDNTKTTQTLDFSNYVGVIPSDLNGKYVVFYTNSEKTYYAWFDGTGTTPDPATDPLNEELAGLIGIRVDISTGVTTNAQVAEALADQLVIDNVNDDYDIVYTPGDEDLVIETDSFDDTNAVTIETIEKGFLYTADTPVNNNPANDPGVHTDVVGKIGIRVNIARNVTTNAELTDATAAAILEQDNAADFEVLYTAGDTFFVISNTNNGNTDDAADSAINGLGNGFAISIVQQGDGEDAALNHVLLSAAATPAQQIDETARSLVNIINKNANENVYAFYITGNNDLPGQFLLESRDIGVNYFNVVANSAATGSLFNPPLSPVPNAASVEGIPESKPNRIFFAKLQQPEAVPLVNFIDVGPEDKEISRILALRESLFILKEDGVYRLTGLNGQYTVDLFDESTKIIAPDSAVVLNNQIYCLTNQGIVLISDTGIDIISKNLDNIFQKITSSNYNYRYTSFGVSYENDRCYWLWVPTNANDNVATQAFRYNTATNAWTRATMSKTCGIVNSGDNKLYIGASDENFIERERKNFDRTDYADREYQVFIPDNGVVNNTITISQTNLGDIGDALVQTQYLTIEQYNQLLLKLDLDPQVGQEQTTLVDFTSYSGTIPADLHTKYFVMYSASDAKKYAIVFDAIGNLTPLNTLIYSDIRDATQIIVNISAATTLSQVTNLTQNLLKTVTFDFVVTHIPGSTTFTAKTVRSGETTDSFDSAINGLNNGFSITTPVQGYGDYYASQNAVSGDNLKLKLDTLAAELDNDPSIIQNDFVAAISNYTGSGTASVANATVITDIGHQLQTGRIVTISNSTTTPNIDGNYIVTKIDNDTFSIPVAVSVSGTLDWEAEVVTFQEIQGAFNTIVNKLNLDNGTLFSNYPLSEDTLDIEVLVTATKFNSPALTVQFAVAFIEGSITLYKGIKNNIIYVPETFGDPSIMKHVREATVMFENANFTTATVGFRSDLSPGFETITFQKSGKGDWGAFVWNEQNWGGGFSGVPFRTYIPRNKQRCRYLQMQYLHNSAREMWAIFGTSYTFKGVSERAYNE